MKHIALLVALAAVASPALRADNYSQTLARIVEASPELRASSAAADAEKAENHTGLNLANPEVELSYQWGVPSYVPDKKTIDVSQGFDFATLSGAKKRLADAKDVVADQSVAATRLKVTRMVDELMTDIVYRRRLSVQYDSAINLMKKTLAAAELAFSHNEMTVIDVNTIKMELSALQTEEALNIFETENLFAALRQMAPGLNIDWSDDRYCDYSLPSDFHTWCHTNAPLTPDVLSARANVALADREISLRKSENLPSFTVGYTSELVTDANYHGVTLGVELPLWANQGRVKAARAARNAAAIEADNAMSEFELSMHALYKKVETLRLLDQRARELRDECDIREPLFKLYSLGNITVHDYLSQLQPLLDLDRKVIDAEYEYQKALVEFRASTLRGQ